MTSIRTSVATTTTGLVPGASITLAAGHAEHGAHDLGGHRAHALKLVHQAQTEVEAAMRFNRH